MFLVRSVCLFVCLSVCLSVGLLANLWTDFDEIFCRGRAWPKDQVIQFWWRSGSRFGSGSPKSEIQILRIGGGLCSLSIAFLFLCAFYVDLLRIVCSGSQCSVEVSADEIFVEGSEAPSVILSALQSAQHQQLSAPDSGCDCCGCDISRQPTRTSETARDTVTDRHSECCSRRHGSKKLANTRHHWHPLLLVIPLRLGLSEINPVYFSAIKVNEVLTWDPLHSGTKLIASTTILMTIFLGETGVNLGLLGLPVLEKNLGVLMAMWHEFFVCWYAVKKLLSHFLWSIHPLLSKK